jgi:hypothetical protein
MAVRVLGVIAIREDDEHANRFWLFLPAFFQTQTDKRN